MEKRVYYISLIISIISIAISAFVAFPNVINTNRGNFVLSTLTALVTILIGWNIFSLIDFNKKKEELDKNNFIIANSLIDIQNHLCRSEGAIEQTISDVYYHLMGLKHPYSKEYFYINHCVCSIMKFSQTGDYHICNALTNALLQVITHPENISVPSKRKMEMLTYIYKVKDHKKIEKYTELVSMVIHISELEDS